MISKISDLSKSKTYKRLTFFGTQIHKEDGVTEYVSATSLNLDACIGANNGFRDGDNEGIFCYYIILGLNYSFYRIEHEREVFGDLVVEKSEFETNGFNVGLGGCYLLRENILAFGEVKAIGLTTFDFVGSVGLLYLF